MSNLKAILTPLLLCVTLSAQGATTSESEAATSASKWGVRLFGDKDSEDLFSSNGACYAHGDSIQFLLDEPSSLKGVRLSFMRVRLKYSKGLGSSRSSESMPDLMVFEFVDDKRVSQATFRVKSMSVDGARRMKTEKPFRYVTGGFYAVQTISGKDCHSYIPGEIHYYDGKRLIPMDEGALADAIAKAYNDKWIENVPPEQCRDALRSELGRLPRKVRSFLQ